MAYSTSHSDGVIELPRYRGRKNIIEQESKPTAAVQDERYDSFDSTFRNEIDDHDNKVPTATELTTTQSLLEKPVVRRLVFRRHWFHSDMTVYSIQPAQPPSPSLPQTPEIPTPNASETTESETPIYHLATYEFNLLQPDIIMYTGALPSPSQVLALAHFRWTRNAKLAFGPSVLDPTSPTTSWELLRNTSSYLRHHTYDFFMRTSQGVQRHFRLTRTRAEDDGVSGWSGWLSGRNYRIVDVEAHETVGVFLADNLRSLTRKGEVRFFRKLEGEVEVGVVLAVGVVSEKATRRERHSKHGGGGG